MTYHAPTETNPPFTTPPTWPFPTSSADWEPDYRLRLLETALVYMWTNGSGPGPPGPVGPQGPAGPAGPATAGLYAAVGTATPPTNGSTIVPPEGFFWVDTSTSQVNPLPPPLNSGQPFTTYTDPYGKIWVAKGGVNGGAYKDPRDVLFAHAYRNAAFNVTNSAAWLACDTVQDDAYGIFSGGGWFTVPIAGLYQCESQFYCSGNPASWLQLSCYKGTTTVLSTNLYGNTANVTAIIHAISTWRFAANEQFNSQVVASNTMPATVGVPGACFSQIRYVGSG